MRESIMNFELFSDYSLGWRSAAAIEKLVDGLSSGLAHQTLLGVTGSGKTFTIANVIQQVQRPTLVLAHNKTLAAQLYGEFKTFFPKNSVEYFVSYYDYYQPEAYVPASDTFIEKDASINEHIEQMRLSGHQGAVGAPGLHYRRHGVGYLRLGRPERLSQHGPTHVARATNWNSASSCAGSRTCNTPATKSICSRGTYRVRGDVIDIFPPSPSARRCGSSYSTTKWNP